MSNATQKEISSIKELYGKMVDNKDKYDGALYGAIHSLLIQLMDTDRWGEPMNTSPESIAYNLRLCALFHDYLAAKKFEEVSSCD